MTRRYSYYPGCSMKGMHKPYDVSVRAVLKALDTELVELDDWNCCGATACASVRGSNAYALCARNLALAERQRVSTDLVAVCCACYLTLYKTNAYFRESPELAQTIKGALTAAGLHYSGKMSVRHLLDVMVNDIGEEPIKSKLVRPLRGLKVAPYYGCQIIRPVAAFDALEAPMSMDALLRWAGADVVEYPLKTACCGGTLIFTSEEVGVRMTELLLRAAVDRGADCIATVSPSCHTNLELFQKRINSELGTDYHVPVLYFTQLLGLALGLSPRELDIHKQLIPAEPVLKKLAAVTPIQSAA